MFFFVYVCFIVINQLTIKTNVMETLTKTTEMFTLDIRGEYASSKGTFTGTRKQVLRMIRDRALEMRENSRKRIPNADHVGSLSNNEHPSALVNLATFQIEKMGAQHLIELMNAYGVLKFELREAL